VAIQQDTNMAKLRAAVWIMLDKRYLDHRSILLTNEKGQKLWQVNATGLSTPRQPDLAI